MKSLGIFVAAVLVFVPVTSAQSLPAGANLLMPPPSALFSTLPDPPLFAAESSPAASVSLSAPPAAASAALASAAAPEPAPAPQGPYGVFPSLYWEIHVAYSYVRFYETPATNVNTSGATGSVGYYFKNWLGLEGEINAGFGSVARQTGKLALAGGGLRAKWAPGAHPYEIWAHALAGEAHFVPRTSYGSASALGYEAGLGLDINARRRLSYRFEGDFVGTRFFSTYQVSPKISVGVVFRF